MPASNNVFQKNANTSLVAQLIWRQGGLSRVDISRLLQLNKSTVSNIISYLMEIGLVSEGERKDATSLGGRKPIELTIARDFGCVFGFDLQPSHYRSVIMGADGSILWEVRGSKRQLSFESFVCSVVDEALNAHRGIQIPILALSFSIPGQIDAKNGVIIHSYPFALKDYHLKDFLKARYDYPIYIENEANCAAWLDLHSTLGFDFSSNAVSVVADFHEESKRNDSVIGIGAGFGVIIDGKVYHGSHNGAGEFCSISWNRGNPNQSGLSTELLKRTIDDREALASWIVDTCVSLVPFMAIMDFDSIILHGSPLSDEVWVRSVLEEKASSFLGVLEKIGCSLIFETQDESVSAKGAALMYLHELYSIPDLEEGFSERKSWREVVEFLEDQRELYMIR